MIARRHAALTAQSDTARHLQELLELAKSELYREQLESSRARGEVVRLRALLSRLLDDLSRAHVEESQDI